MGRLLRIFLALFVVIGATGAELRVPAPQRMDCCPPGDDDGCGCNMPLPKGPQNCGISIPAPASVPARSVSILVESATAADPVAAEPRPWPAAWSLQPVLGQARRRARLPRPVDTGPPPLASERSAELGVFRI